MKVTHIGLDLAKRIFAVHGIDERGVAQIRRSLSRRKVVTFFAKIEPGLAPAWWTPEIGRQCPLEVSNGKETSIIQSGVQGRGGQSDPE